MDIRQTVLSEDSICDDLLSIATWILNFGMTLNASVFVLRMVINMDLWLFLSIVFCLVSLNPVWHWISPDSIKQGARQLPHYQDDDQYMVSHVSRVSKDWSSRAVQEKSKPFRIEFSGDWGNPDDKIFEWYRAQPYTRFKSAQHRKSRESPFYHEFLILILNNGSYCRLERTGDGKRIDAISRTGSEAHDYIQLIQEVDYEVQLDSCSDVIAEIEFPHEFDLCDVFAICYAMQKNKHSSKYTLQRYNCYFFCCTILLVLTRRLANWENTFTNINWDDTLDDVLAELLHRSEPAHFLIEAMHRDLRAEHGNDTFRDLNLSFAQVLWGSTLRLVTNEVPEREVGKSVLLATESPETCPSSIYHAFNGTAAAEYSETDIARVLDIYGQQFLRSALNHVDELELGIEKIRNVLVDEFIKSQTEYYKSYYKSLWETLWVTVPREMIETEFDWSKCDSEPSLSSRLSTIAWVLRSYIQGIWAVVDMDDSQIVPIDDEFEEVFKPRPKSYLSLRAIYLNLKSSYKSLLVKARYIRSMVSYMLLDTFSQSYGYKLDDFCNTMEHLSVLERIRGIDIERWMECVFTTVVDRALLWTLDMAQKAGIPQLSVWHVMLKAVGGLDSRDELWGGWCWAFVERSFQKFVQKTIHNQTRMRVRIKSLDTGFMPTDVTVVEFQQKIQSRIRSHANRVAVAKLGAADLVYQDIESAMTGVWMALPPGHGPCDPCVTTE
ncbi:hypothetical protein RhiJN_09974 [Ceratobasidium sp. AG-Ba]|nr:hypothetical protein RhiJN_09974 [Ceratobasidium sp. AG-Ba]